MKFFSRIRPTASSLVLLSAMFLLGHTTLYAQATGGVTGAVEDTTGAVVPKAVIVLTNVENGSQTSRTSNSVGAFAFTGLTPATYSFKITATNFEPWQSQPFPVHPGPPLNFSDIRMQVGTATAAVTVEAQTETGLAALDTAAQSDVISAEELNTLSVIGRDATELVRMLPGYSMSTGDQGLFNRPGYNSAVVGLSGPTGAFSANGAGVTGIAVLTDGISLTDIASNSGSVQQINIEMVNSVTATNSSYGAVYAKGPAVISAESKVGTAAFHGEAYFAARNTDLNSNDWYDNYLRQSRPAGSYYYPGGQIEGPLPLPFTDFNRGRKRLFFFAGYEYSNQSFEANQEAISGWVPTLAERQGDFSPASLDAQLCGSRPDGATNPNSIQAMCNSDNYLPNGTQVANYNAQPYANPSGVALVNWFPLPNADPFTNPFGYNYIQQVIQQQNVQQFKGTLQYNVTDNDKLFLVYGLQRENDQDPVALNQSFPSGAIPYPGGITTGDISNVLSAHWTRILGATMTNEFAAAMSFVSLPGKMGNPKGVDRYDMSYYNCGSATERAAGSCPYTAGNNFNYLGMYKNGGDLSIPAVTGNNGAGYPNLAMPGGFYNNQVHTKKVDPILQDDFSWQWKNHLLQFGGYWETGTYNGIADSQNAYPQGQFSDNPGNGYFEYSGQPFATAQFVSCENPSTLGNLRNSGANYLGSCFNPTAMMYEGYADTWNQTNFTPEVDMRFTTVAGYVNDTWRFHRLNLIAGARIEHLGPWTDKHNNGLATFSDSLYNTNCGGYTRGCSGANMPGLTWYAQKTGVSNSVNSPPTVYFTPRVGASWDVWGKGKTVVRGGWGIYRNEEQFNPYALAAATAQNYKTSQLVGTLSFSQIDSETPQNPPDFNAYTISASDTVRPIYYEYSFSIDQRLPWNSVAQFALVSSHNINLGSYNNSSYNEASDMNVICGIETGCPANKNPNMNVSGATYPDSLFQVNLGGLPQYMLVAQGLSSGIGSMSTQEQDWFRPYPFYQHVYALKHDFYSNYNSFQAQWNKQAGVFTYGANYTFAKNLATAASWNNNIVDPVNLRNDYNPVPYDRTQTVNVHYLVNLGQRYKGKARLLSDLANGWQVSGISTVSSGFPLASENGENFGFGYGGVLPVGVPYANQTSPSNDKTCQYVYLVPSINGTYHCTSNMSPITWLGTPDVQLMPTLLGNPKAGLKTHQFINPLAFGLPQPVSNGVYRLPYLHGPAYLDHDVTLLKNFTFHEKQNLQLRMAAFNVFNHPLVSFNNQNTDNLTLNFNQAVVGQPFTSNVLQYPNFGVANIKVGNRLVEVEAKYSF
jgi:Carboxypeptidase regulatory-like domain